MEGIKQLTLVTYSDTISHQEAEHIPQGMCSNRIQGYFHSHLCSHDSEKHTYLYSSTPWQQQNSQKVIFGNKL